MIYLTKQLSLLDERKKKGMEKNYKILIVDDDKDITELITIVLEGEGFAVAACHTGDEAIDFLKSSRKKAREDAIDLIILDIMLPDKSGYRVCKEIRQTSNVPILFLSAMSGESDKITGFLSGGDDYLSKPFSTSELISRVKSLIRRCYIYQNDCGTPPIQNFPTLLSNHRLMAMASLRNLQWLNFS